MILTSIAKWAFRIYLAAYVGLSGHVLYDNHASNSQRLLAETRETLKIERFKATINGTEKTFTLVGEVHMYNRKDYERALQLIETHDSFASEYGDVRSYFRESSLRTIITDELVLTPCIIPLFYLSLAQGRNYPSVSVLAGKQGRKVHTLEKRDDVYANLSYKDRLALFSACAQGAFIGPINYYFAKDLSIYQDTGEESGFFLKDSLVDKRDPKMGDSLVELLQRDDVDNLLVNMGRLHVPGVTAHVASRIPLEKID